MTASIEHQTRQPEGRSRWIALYVLCAGVLMIVLDVTVVNVALPSIQNDLRFSTSSLAWVVNAYLISFGGLLLLAGRLGDLFGRRTVLLIGLGVFTVASLLCGLAQSQEVLVGARFLQGIGGAMTSAVILGMIVTMFPDPAEQAKAIGVYAFVASAGGSVGLLAGGVLTQSINWHWIFFVNIPIGIATAVLVRRLLDRDQGLGIGEGADVPGAILITSSLMLGVYTIVKPAADYGWGSARTLGLGALSLALLAAFVAREATARRPLIPLRIFRSRNVTGANMIQVLTVAGMFGMFFLGSLYLRRVLHYDALEIGFAFLPVTITMGTLSIRYSERLIMRFGARTTLLPGLALVVAGAGAVRASARRTAATSGRSPDDDPAGHRRRELLPRADDDRDVGRDAKRRRPGLRPRQHDGAGRRGARAGRARDAVDLTQQQAARARHIDARGVDERLPPRVLDRSRARAGRDRGRRDRASAAAPSRRRAGER